MTARCLTGLDSYRVLHQSPCTPSAMPSLTALSTSGSRLDGKRLHVRPATAPSSQMQPCPTERHDPPAAALRCIQPPQDRRSSRLDVELSLGTAGDAGQGSRGPWRRHRGRAGRGAGWSGTGSGRQVTAAPWRLRGGCSGDATCGTPRSMRTPAHGSCLNIRTLRACMTLTSQSACSGCVWSASAVITVSARSNPFSSGRNGRSRWWWSIAPGWVGRGPHQWCDPSRRVGGPAGWGGGRCRAGSCRRPRPPPPHRLGEGATGRPATREITDGRLRFPL
jgi:hypothetical protein